jgi:hypothetical protein
LEHVEFFEQLINGIKSESDQDSIVHVAHAMFRLYGDVFRSLPEYAQPVFAELA